MRKLIFALISILAGQVMLAQNAGTESGKTINNAATINSQAGLLNDFSGKIIREGETNSRVMDYAYQLTDVSGPRLTVSPGFTRAANWARGELTRVGLVNARLEPWGEFGKGWQQERCYIAMTAPYYQPIIAVPRAWTGSTPGNKAISGEVMLVKAKDSVELSKYAGKLQGKIIMLWSPAQLKPSFEPDAGPFY